MSRTRRWLVVGLLLVAGFGAAQAVLRGGGEPPPREIVPWEPWADLGEPPWDGPVLLEFSADWCVPCRRLQVTVFRDPAFARVLEQHDLRPVRLHYESIASLKWARISSRYDVGGYPAMVVIAPDGRHAPPIVGVATVQDYDERFGKALARLDNALYFHEPRSLPEQDRLRLTLRHFDTWWYMNRANRTDWRENPTAAFSSWVGEHVDLVSDSFGKEHPLAFDYYKRYRIRTVPTMVLEDWRGVELQRFEGLEAIERAPADIARIAREQGLALPDPPVPHTQTEKGKRPAVPAEGQTLHLLDHEQERHDHDRLDQQQVEQPE